MILFRITFTDLGPEVKAVNGSMNRWRNNHNIFVLCDSIQTAIEHVEANYNDAKINNIHREGGDGHGSKVIVIPGK